MFQILCLCLQKENIVAVGKATKVLTKTLVKSTKTVNNKKKTTTTVVIPKPPRCNPTAAKKVTSQRLDDEVSSQPELTDSQQERNMSWDVVELSAISNSSDETCSQNR